MDVVRPWISRAVVALTAIQVGVGLAAVTAQGDDGDRRPVPARTVTAVAAVAPTSTTTIPPVETAPPPAPPVETTAPVPAPPAGPRKLTLIGDSMAYTAAQGLAPHAARFGFEVRNEGIMGCGVVRGGPYRYFGATRDMEPRCEAWPAAWQEALVRSRADLVGIVVGRWELMDRTFEGRWTNLFDPAFVAYLETEVDHSLSVVQASGARPVVFTTPYYLRGLRPDGGIFPEDDPARVDAMNVILRRVAERRGVPVVDVGGWLSPEGRYTRDVAGTRVRSDGVHLTRQTGDLLAPWLFPQLQAL